jgi:ABC-type multidrug transport system fused ATPase/permease subunit
MCLAYIPFIMILFILLGRTTRKAQSLRLEANQALGGFTEECLSALKLVVSFAREDLTIKKYGEKAAVTKSITKRANVLNSIFFGAIRCMMFGFFFYTFLVAITLVKKGVKNPATNEPYNIREVVAITQSMIMGITQLLQIIPNLTNVSKAQVVGRKVFDVIERVPQIKDSEAVAKEGKHDIDLKREIAFKGVHFRYPTTPDVMPDQLQGVSFSIKAGTSTAIVGPSGSGKSTIV